MGGEVTPVGFTCRVNESEKQANKALYWTGMGGGRDSSYGQTIASFLYDRTSSLGRVHTLARSTQFVVLGSQFVCVYVYHGKYYLFCASLRAR